MMNFLMEQKIEEIPKKSIYKSRLSVYNKNVIVALFF